MTKSFGVVYVATKRESFLTEAACSARTVKRHSPRCPVTLFTDLADHPLCSQAAVFDDVVPAPRTVGYRSAWSEGLMNRLLCLRHSPYDRTLYLDTDTEVVTPAFEDVFRILDRCDIALAEANPEDSFSRYHYQKRMLNTGVILYRLRAPVIELFENWVSLANTYFRFASVKPLPKIEELDHIGDDSVKRKLLSNDQVSLVSMLSPDTNRFGLKFEVLDYAWNHRGSVDPFRNITPVRVRHWPRPAASA